MPTFCSQCGAQNRDDARFCTRCSAPLAPPTPQRNPEPAPYQPGMQVQAAYRQPPYQPSYADQPIFTPVAGSYAGLGSRFGAWFIDGLIQGVILVPGYILFGVTSAAVGEEPSVIGGFFLLLSWLAALAFFLYNVHLLGRDGATIGKRVLKIRVLDQTGQPLGFGRALLREICKAFISPLVCYLGFLWAIWDQEKQTWHDKIMSTHVYDA